MANIAALLARILTTRYGRDMRQDLHDSIEAVNNDTENALGKSLSFTTNTRKLKLLAKDGSVLSEAVIPSGGSGSGQVDSVNGLFPDENGNVELNLGDINDVDITSAADGQTLIYNAKSGKWVNGSGGGGTTDYTDLNNKPSVNGVTLSGNKTSADLGISGGSNENLLDNPWFTVNQRGFSSALLSTSTSKLVDRWYALGSSGISATVTTDSDNNINIADATSTADSKAYIRQLVECNVDKMRGQMLTFSVMFSDGSIYSTSKPFPTASGGGVSQTFTIPNASLILALNDEIRSGVHYIMTDCRLYKSVTSPVTFSIKAMKLELGSASTLALDVAPNYTEELLKCQRYYYPLPRKWFANTAGINQYTQIAFIPLPTKMRTTPTLSGSLDLEGAYNGASVTETVATSSVVIDSNDLQNIYATITSTNQYDRNGWVLVKPSSGAALSAEL